MTSPLTSRELLEQRQLELRVMAQELAVLAEQIRLTDQATRAFQAAQRREWELRAEQHAHAHAHEPWPRWLPLALGAFTGLALGAVLYRTQRSY